MKTLVLVLVSITLMACVHHVASQPKPTCPSTCNYKDRKVRGPDGCCCVCRQGYVQDPYSDRCVCPKKCNTENKERGNDGCGCKCVEGLVWGPNNQNQCVCPKECNSAQNRTRIPDGCACVCKDGLVPNPKYNRCECPDECFPLSDGQVRGPDGCACVCKYDGMVLDRQKYRCDYPIGPEARARVTYPECKFVDIIHECDMLRSANKDTFLDICSHTTDPSRTCERTITCERPKAAWDPFHVCVAQCWASYNAAAMKMYFGQDRNYTKHFFESRFDYELHAYGNDDECLKTWVQKDLSINQFLRVFDGLKESYTLDQFKKFTFWFHAHDCDQPWI